MLLWLVAQLLASTPGHCQFLPSKADPSAAKNTEQPASTSLSTAQIVPEIVATEQNLILIKERLAADMGLPPIMEMLREQDASLLQLQEYVADHPAPSIAPGRHQEIRSALLRFHSQLNRWQGMLQKQVIKLDENAQELQQMSLLWQQTRREANERATPNTLLRQIDLLLVDIRELEAETLNQMGSLV
jgi:hypothetical protein